MAADSASMASSGLPNGKSVIAVPLAASLLLHGLLIALFFVLRASAPPPSAPVYRVDLVAAPPGERAAGVVKPQPVAPASTAIPIRPKTAPHEMPAPNTKVPPRAKTPEATPTLPAQTKPDTKVPTTAGGGETGGRGTDVVTVNTGGIEFPYPSYLENIVRQIAIRFKRSPGGALRAEVFFIINRDGSVAASSIQLVTRSGVYSFDTEALGAVEAASRSFEPLPPGFTGESLPVTFRFDPRILR